MLRKFLLFSLFIFFPLLIGCGDASLADAFIRLDQWMEDNGKVKVLSTIGMIDDLVKEIGGERVDHIPLILGDIDPHFYELVKGDEEKFSCADVIFYNGLGLEHGASLAYRLKVHGAAHSLGARIARLHPEWILEDKGQIDPHIWMDISLWMEAARGVIEVLSQVDAEGKAVYEVNGERLLKSMLSVHKEVRALMLQVPTESRYLATSHDAFNYFVRAYFSEPGERESGVWAARFSAPEGLAPDGRLSSAHLKRVIVFLMEHRVHCVFPESNVSRDALKKITESCPGVRLSKESLYGDAMGPRGSDADSYLKMIQCNAEVIKRELLCQ